MHKYVLIISAVFPPEPVVSAKLSMDVYKALTEAGYRVKVMHPYPTRPLGFTFDSFNSGLPDTDEVIVDSFVCPESNLLGRMRESWSFGKECAKYISKHHDEIMFIYANAWQLFGQRIIVNVAKRYNIPRMIHVQDVYPEAYTNKMPKFLGNIAKSILLPMDKNSLLNCHRVIAISEKMKSYLCSTRNIPADKVSIVVNWQDEKDFIDYKTSEESQRVTGAPFTFMYLGNIGPVAGVDLLIDAFNNSSKNNSRLVIAGSGSMKDALKEKALNNKRIEFWEVPQGKVPEIQGKADCMLLPIKKGAATSSIPSKLPAYMFSSKPIIGSVDNNSDTAEAIRNANCGLVVEPENIKQLSIAMDTVIAMDRKRLLQYGENGRCYALEHFSKASNLNKLLEIIKSEIKERN